MPRDIQQIHISPAVYSLHIASSNAHSFKLKARATVCVASIKVFIYTTHTIYIHSYDSALLQYSRNSFILPCAGILERNEAKSQQMVAEELARIVQSELLELRQRNVAETTTRVRLENQIGQLKVGYSKIVYSSCRLYTALQVCSTFVVSFLFFSLHFHLFWHVK